MEPARVLGFRLARHLLAPRSASASIEEVASSVLGLHAQVGSCASLMAWARSSAVRPEDAGRALWDKRSLVRTWAMRNTLHLLPASELGLYSAARGGSEFKPASAWLRWFGVSLPELHALNAALAETLTERPLSRRELAEQLGPRLSPSLAAGISGSWGGLFKPAARAGLIVSGPPRSGETTFVAAAAWLGAPVAAPPVAEARLEMARRYLGRFGPATLADLSRWLGVVAADLRSTWRSLPLAPVTVEDRQLFVLEADLDRLLDAEPASGVSVLGGFDTWLLGHADRSLVMAPQHRSQVTRTAGWISAVVLDGGRVVATWTSRREGRRLVVELKPLGRVRAGVRKAAAAEFERLRGFLGAGPGA